jgi:Trk K+ transport system NAD-binding subunit
MLSAEPCYGIKIKLLGQCKVNIYLYGNDALTENTLRVVLNQYNKVFLVSTNKETLDLLSHFPNVSAAHDLSFSVQNIFQHSDFANFDLCIAISDNYLQNMLICNQMQQVHDVPRIICLTDNNVLSDLYESSSFNIVNIEDLLSEKLNSLFPTQIDSNQRRLL